MVFCLSSSFLPAQRQEEDELKRRDDEHRKAEHARREAETRRQDEARRQEESRRHEEEARRQQPERDSSSPDASGGSSSVPPHPPTPPPAAQHGSSASDYWDEQLNKISSGVNSRKDISFAKAHRHKGEIDWAWRYLSRQAYTLFPPKRKSTAEVAALLEGIDSIPHLEKGLLAALRKFSILYHPDKNLEFGDDWSKVAVSLTSFSNDLLDDYKARIF